MYQEKTQKVTEKAKDAYKRLPKLKTCFYRCKLKTGTLIVALIYIIAASFSITQVIVRHLMYINCLKKTEKNDKNEKIEEKAKKEDEYYGYVGTAELVFTILICLTELITTSLMLYGSLKRNPKLMVPFMIMEVIFFIGFFVGSWVLIISSFIDTFGLGLLYLLIFHGLLAMAIYVNLIVHSRYNQLKMKKMAMQNVLY